MTGSECCPPVFVLSLKGYFANIRYVTMHGLFAIENKHVSISGKHRKEFGTLESLISDDGISLLL